MKMEVKTSDILLLLLFFLNSVLLVMWDFDLFILRACGLAR